MAFKISEQARRRSEARGDLMERLHALPDVFLGAELLRLAREARAAAIEKLGNPDEITYEANLIWDVIPELCHRLGVPSARFDQRERTDHDLNASGGERLRLLAGSRLMNADLLRLAVHVERGGKDLTALDALSGDVANGNPVAMALDRVAPPAPGFDRDRDPIARYMAEICRNRFGHEEILAWEPAFQDYAHAKGGIDLSGVFDAEEDELLEP